MADETQIQTALAEIVKARDDAAAPLTFTAEAAKASDDRSEAQFRANLPQVPGGWTTVRDGILKASVLFGEVAKAIARFHDPTATQITLDQMATARGLAEHECKLNVATKKGKHFIEVTVLDGIIC